MRSIRIESIQLFPIRVVDSFSSEIRLLLDIILHLIELTFVASSLYLRRQLTAANTQLFEFNDSITRSTFVNIVSPYLRDVRIQESITDFLLVCDDSNNPPDVIDRNEFIADIYIKPARSINFIGLTFVATRTGVSFEEVVGTV